MQVLLLLRLAALSLGSAQSSTVPSVFDQRHSVTYNDLERNGIKVFLNVRYGQDTSGENRFRPPTPYHPDPGSTISAQSLGPACPQEVGRDCAVLRPFYPSWFGSTEEVFWVGTNGEPTTSPDGLILESIDNGPPVIHVAINYRLGFFGFTQSKSLEQEKSENAGLRDQRLAIEWVRDNTDAFGGDPEKFTIYGQSSGGFAVTSQILAYGGKKPVPFHQGICESQAIATGLTGNYTRDAAQVLVDYVGCNATSMDDPETVSCLRSLDMQTLLDASLVTYRGDLGDIWLPIVDGDFWPAAPSVLLREGRFANITTMIGWTQDDLTLYTDASIQTDRDTFDSVRHAYPDVSVDNVDRLLSLYPVGDFSANVEANLSSEFYRAARISRDVLMVCQPMHLAGTLAAAGNDVFLYDWNQTIFGPALAYVRNLHGIGVPHTSEFAYVYGNLSAYDVNGYPFEPTPADYALVHRGSRSWSTFASTGKPSLEGHDTFVGFEKAYGDGDAGEQPYIFVAGGPYEGLSAVDGPRSTAEVAAQKLRDRCAFINSREMIEQLRY